MRKEWEILECSRSEAPEIEIITYDKILETQAAQLGRIVVPDFDISTLRTGTLDPIFSYPNALLRFHSLTFLISRFTVIRSVLARFAIATALLWCMAARYTALVMNASEIAVARDSVPSYLRRRRFDGQMEPSWARRWRMRFYSAESTTRQSSSLR